MVYLWKNTLNILVPAGQRNAVMRSHWLEIVGICVSYLPNGTKVWNFKLYLPWEDIHWLTQGYKTKCPACSLGTGPSCKFRTDLPSWVGCLVSNNDLLIHNCHSSSVTNTHGHFPEREHHIVQNTQQVWGLHCLECWSFVPLDNCSSSHLQKSVSTHMA